MPPPPRPRRPARLSPSALNAVAAEDPGARLEAAHTSAAAVIDRLRDASDPGAAERMAAAVEGDEGLDAAARLWAVAAPVSLPGALWRLVALRAGVRRTPSTAAAEFEAGRSRLPVAEVVAGVAEPPGPDEVIAMVDAVLRGVGDSDVAVTFERAAAFARVCAAGRAVLADEASGNPLVDRAGRADGAGREVYEGQSEPPAPERTAWDIDDGEAAARRLTHSALALSQTADHLEAAAGRWRVHALD